MSRSFLFDWAGATTLPASGLIGLLASVVVGGTAADVPSVLLEGAAACGETVGLSGLFFSTDGKKIEITIKPRMMSRQPDPHPDPQPLCTCVILMTGGLSLIGDLFLPNV